MMSQSSETGDERELGAVIPGSAGAVPESSGRNDPAGELFQTAALLVGDQHEAVALLERAFDLVTVDPCADARAFERQARSRLFDLSVQRLAKADPAAFTAPSVRVGEDESCLDADELSAAGLSQDEFIRLIESGEIAAGRTRTWMEQLPAALRIVFVARAIFGENPAGIASKLRAAAGPRASGWTEAAVRVSYRRALCMLASSLAGSKSQAAPSR